MLFLDIELLYYYANKLCRAKGDNKLGGKNWYLKFYKRNSSIKILRVRLIKKDRFFNEDFDDYIK